MKVTCDVNCYSILLLDYSMCMCLSGSQGSLSPGQTSLRDNKVDLDLDLMGE